MKQQKRRRSFRSFVSISMLICWILPILVISITASLLLNRNYNRALRRTVDAELTDAMWQVEMTLDSAMEEIRKVALDDAINQAYQDYCRKQDKTELYVKIADFLNSYFSGKTEFKAVFASFLDDSVDVLPYIAAHIAPNGEAWLTYREHVQPQVLAASLELETRSSVLVVEDQLYLVRNLIDRDSKPFAVLAAQLDRKGLVSPLLEVSRISFTDVSVDGISIPLPVETEPDMDPSRMEDFSYSMEADGLVLSCSGRIYGLNIWTSVPMIRWIVLFLAALVGPMLIIYILVFNWNINHPIEILMDASSRMQNGQRGVQIQQKAPNREFELLYRDFNIMSRQMDAQFQKLYEEQQALQQAKIKALQSQINPHFLNNTLEVINWEARLADNERICVMIESLSTMLDAAIGRDHRSQVRLREELNYVEAYLHITQERLGDRLTITRDIAPETLECSVPLLILQPILENAVEYDLSRTGGSLNIRTYLRGDMLHLEVEHDGRINAEGWRKIRDGLIADTEPQSRVNGRSVGIRNVANRLALIYGSDFKFDIREEVPGKIFAEMVFFKDMELV